MVKKPHLFYVPAEPKLTLVRMRGIHGGSLKDWKLSPLRLEQIFSGTII
jgi:hypothetical protein